MTGHAEYPRAARATSGKAILALTLALVALIAASVPLISIPAALAGVVVALLARRDLKEQAGAVPSPRAESGFDGVSGGVPAPDDRPALGGFGLSLAAFLVAGAVLAWAALMHVLPVVASTLFLLV